MWGEGAILPCVLPYGTLCAGAAEGARGNVLARCSYLTPLVIHSCFLLSIRRHRESNNNNTSIKKKMSMKTEINVIYVSLKIFFMTPLYMAWNFRSDRSGNNTRHFMEVFFY